MEYVIVEFPERRLVYVDEQDQGYNQDDSGHNRTLAVGAGRHRFSLGGRGYSPAFQDVLVQDTSSINPQRIVFSPETADGHVA